MDYIDITKEELINDLPKLKEEPTLTHIHFKDLFNNASTGMAICRIIGDNEGKPYDFTPLKINSAAQRLTGYDTQKLVGKLASEIASKENVSRMAAIFGSVVDLKKTNCCEYYISLNKRTMEINAFPLDGELFAFSFVEITEKIKTREIQERYIKNLDRVNQILQQSSDLNQMMKDILNTTLDIFNVDRAWLLQPCKTNTEKMNVLMECTTDGFPGAFKNKKSINLSQGSLDLINQMYANQDIQTLDNQQVKKYFTSLEKYQVINRMFMLIQLPQNESLMFGLHQCSNFHEWTSDDKKLFREIGIRLSDSFHRLSILKELKESEARLSYILDHSVSVIYKFNFNPKRFEYVSPSIEEVFGYSPDFFLSNNISVLNEHYHPDDFEVFKINPANLSRENASDFQTRIEYRFKHPKLGYRWLRDTRSLIFNNSGLPISIVGNINDITNEKQVEIALTKAKEKAEESDRLKSAFLAKMNHELRTPLNHIIGFGDLIQHLSVDEEVIDFANIIGESGRGLLEILEDIFTLASLDQGIIKARNQSFKGSDIFYDLKISLQEILLNSGKSNQIKLLFKCDKHIHESCLYTDINKINQVMLNLFKNAVKFTEKGFIEFGLDKSDNDCITFSVKDTGIGIPEDKLNIVFDYFRQVDDSSSRKHEGIGIGLAISKKISEAMSGNITLKSELGKGSLFNLTIPITAKE